MNVQLPYNSVEECVEGGIAQNLLEEKECADLACIGRAARAWLWRSEVFIIDAGKLITRGVEMWFPLCPKHEPIQEVKNESGEPVPGLSDNGDPSTPSNGDDDATGFKS